MTNTITAPIGEGFGAHRAGREALAGFLTTATAETAVGQRVRGLLGELTDIERDRAMASRMVEPGTWLAELAREEHDVWDHIFEALSSTNTKEEQ